MKEVTIKVYPINELDQPQQEKAFYNWLESDDYTWNAENKDTLEKFSDIFPIKVKKYEYGYQNFIDWNFTESEEIENLSGIRLMKYIYNNYFQYIFKGKYYSTKGHYDENNKYHYKHRYSKIIFENCCPLTGYCMDDDILEPIYKFLKNPEKHITFYHLLSDCLYSWVHACQNDYEHSTSKEFFIEECQANERLFYSDGKEYYH